MSSDEPGRSDEPGTSAEPGMSRRAFLGIAGGVGVAAAGGALAWNALVRDHLEASSGSATSPAGAGGAPGTNPAGGAHRVLVVLQLSGGNDGLNTLVPAGDGRYFDARPTLQVKEAEVLALGGAAYGLHPKLAPLVPLWDGGRLAAVESIGFLQGQSRSHFQASDLWWSALPGEERTTGWLGRWLDRSGDVHDPLRAIALGAGSPALVGEQALSTVVLDPAAFSLLAPRGADAAQLTAAFRATAAPLATQPELAAAQGSVPSALHAVELLAKATSGGAGAGGTEAEERPGGNGQQSVAELLDVAAGVIDLDIGTRVIVVGAGGFDTHANQAERHPALLEDLGNGVSSFLAKIDAQGRSGEVVVMTTSEFGRRVTENGSGTDHGEGGVQFLAGAPVHGKQVVGDADLGNLDQGDVRSTIDTRSLYAAALDWLSGDANLSDEVLGGSFDRHGLIQS